MVSRSLAPSIVVAAISAMGLINAGPIAYSAFDGSQFGTVDLSTGQTAIIADLATPLAGLGVANGELFAAASGGTTMFRIDPSTGSLTTVGSTPFSIAALGSTSAGLFALSTSGGLYSIDPNSANTNFIGSTGLGGYLSNGGATLYDGSTTGYLRTIDTTNGASTVILNGSGAGIGGMVFDQGNLYLMTGNPPGELGIFGVSQIGGTGKNILSLAVLSTATPEPSSTILLGSALGALALWSRKRNHGDRT